MTADVVYLQECAALPLLLIKEVFGTSQLTWSSEAGVELSTEKVSVEVNGNRYYLPVLKNDYSSPKLLLNLNDRPEMTQSLYSRSDGEQILIGGPSGNVTRNCELYRISPVVWVSGNEKSSDCQGTITLKTHASSHIFNFIPCIKASHNRSSLILPENWISFTGKNPEVLIETQSIPSENNALTFNRIITENDVRVAKRKNQTIRLNESSRLTPAARDLGKDLKIFR
ncbi:MAG: hypothetical protein J0L62_09755 [Bacteroidetes bacterium]|nr:hypothetical protein [Bacteroidota bacterium]